MVKRKTQAKNKKSVGKVTKKEDTARMDGLGVYGIQGPGIVNPGILGSSFEIASALNLGISNKGIFNDYKGALGLQNGVLNSIDAASINQSQINKINSCFVSPVNGAILDVGLNAVNAGKLLFEGCISSKDFATINSLSAISLDVIKDQQGIFLSGLEKNGLSRLNIDSMSPIPMIATGIDMMTRAVSTFPSIELPTLRSIREENFYDREEISNEQKKLDIILEKIDKSLVETRRGCWRTFNTKGPDYIRQSSCSMRGLVDTLLRIISPDEKVIKTDYYRNSERAKEKKPPTRVAKIYYAVDYDTERAEYLERLAGGFDKIYQNLSAWDHVPINDDQFVRGTFIIIEGYLNLLLSKTKH